MEKQLTIRDMLCRMEESNLVRNIDSGEEYTGFKVMYSDLMIKKGLISEKGRVYDISKRKDSKHILDLLRSIEAEESPDMVMTSGSYLSMNRWLQRLVTIYLKAISKKGRVRLYAGKDVSKLFKGSAVQMKYFDRKKHFIPHFIKTKTRFNLVLPHTELKLIRVDLDSEMFDEEQKNNILIYFDKLIADFDEAIKS